MYRDDEGLDLGTSAHLFVMSLLQKADEDGGRFCLTPMLAGVLGSVTGFISLKKYT